MSNPKEKQFLSLHEVGAAIGRSARTVLRLIHDKALKAHRLRGRWVITPEDFRNFINNLPGNC